MASSGPLAVLLVAWQWGVQYTDVRYRIGVGQRPLACEQRTTAVALDRHTQARLQKD